MIYPNLHHNNRNPRNENRNNRKNQSIILPPIQLTQLLEITQHHLARKFTLAFLSRAKGKRDFGHTVDGEGGFQKEIKGDFKAVGVEVCGLIELRSISVHSS